MTLMPPATPLASSTQPLLPPWAPRVAVVLLAALLLGVAGLRLSGYSPAVQPGAVVAERALRFADAADGAVVVSAENGAPIARLHGEQGFLRGVLRGLARDRRAQGVPADRPLHLSLRDDGRLLLTDPDTGARIDLASFGPDNAAVFAAWLPSPSFRPQGGSR